jgi:two-component system, cell cycle response regulator DivK
MSVPVERERPVRILLVEDHEDVRVSLSRRLKRRGYDVLTAADGQAGVDEARAKRPDLVLLGMDLPGMDECGAARILRQDPSTSATPIIALAVCALSSGREKAIAAGCDALHAEPIVLSDLLDEIEALTGRAPKPQSVPGTARCAGQ